MAESGGRDVRDPGERDARAPSIEDFDRYEIIAAIREVFAAGEQLNRETATREVARKLGFARTGPRIAEAIDLALVAAVKRGVIKSIKRSGRGWLSLDCRQIGDYPRDLLVDTLLSAMGRGWTEREEAVRGAARHLGFRRTGSAIRDAFKSVITGAIRRGLLEYDGTAIRKRSA